jgi:hypothetical protein
LKAAPDFLEAGKQAGGGYWCEPFALESTLPSISRISTFTEKLIWTSTLAPEEYLLALQLAQLISRAKPEDSGRLLLFAKALYRVGRYAEALSHLEGWQHRRIISQIGQCFMTGWPVALLNKQPVEWDVVQAMAFLAMTQHRLGHRDRALAALTDLRTMYDQKLLEWPTSRNLFREAEALIEGRPPPGK